MATDDDTSKPRRSRRSQPKDSAAVPAAQSLIAAAPPPASEPPRTLEEAIENARTLMLQVRSMLYCLHEVLLYSDDDDGVMHAEVAEAAAGWINDAAAELDLVTLRPLIEALRQRGGGGSSEGEPDPDATNHGPYQVREPMPVYLV